MDLLGTFFLLLPEYFNFQSCITLLLHSWHVLCSKNIYLYINKQPSLHCYITPLKSSTARDGCCLAGTEPGPWGMFLALWLPDALPGHGSSTSTAAAGGHQRLPTNCWQGRRAYLASATRKGLAARIHCVRKLIRLRIMKDNKATQSASSTNIFPFLGQHLCASHDVCT